MPSGIRRSLLACFRACPDTIREPPHTSGSFGEARRRRSQLFGDLIERRQEFPTGFVGELLGTVRELLCGTSHRIEHGRFLPNRWLLPYLR